MVGIVRGIVGAGLFWVSGIQAAPVLNEFVSRPHGEEGEWVEVLNQGEIPWSPEGWSLRDATGKARRIEAAPLIPPGGFLLLASRPESLIAHFELLSDLAPVVRPDGWPVLNDRDPSSGTPADVLVLSDPQGGTVDSLAYFESWLPPDAGRSLERADPSASGTAASAWGWSVDPARATPGRSNSISTGGRRPASEGSWDGPREVHPGRRPAVFSYRWPGPGTLAIALLDLEGRRVSLLQPAEAVAGSGRWVWGAGQTRPQRSGVFFLCMRWEGETGRLLRVCRRIWVTL